MYIAYFYLLKGVLLFLFFFQFDVPTSRLPVRPPPLLRILPNSCIFVQSPLKKQKKKIPKKIQRTKRIDEFPFPKKSCKSTPFKDRIVFFPTKLITFFLKKKTNQYLSKNKKIKPKRAHSFFINKRKTLILRIDSRKKFSISNKKEKTTFLHQSFC